MWSKEWAIKHPHSWVEIGVDTVLLLGLKLDWEGSTIYDKFRTMFITLWLGPVYVTLALDM